MAYGTILTGFDKVSYRKTEKSPELPEGTQELVDAYIASIKQEKEEQERIFFNAPKAHVFRHKLKTREDGGKTLELKLGITDYFTFDFFAKKQPENLKANAYLLSVGTVLITSDNKLVLGNKSELGEMSVGDIQITGARYIKPENLGKGRRIKSEALLELGQEIYNLDDSKKVARIVESIKPLGLFNKEFDQPMLGYLVVVKKDEKATIKAWEKIPEEKREFSELKFIPFENTVISELLEQEKEGKHKIRTHARACLEHLLTL